MEPDCLVPGRTFPANPRSSSVQRQPACRHLPRTSHQTKILLSKQNLLFNSSHYSPGMHLPGPSIDMQQRQRPEKTLKNLALFFCSALCISLNWWRRSKCLWLSFERFLYMQTTLEIKQTETMIGIALKKKANVHSALWGSCNWEIRFGIFHFLANSWPFSGKMSLLLSNSLSFDKILLVKIEEKIAKHAIFQTLNAFLCYMGVFAKSVPFLLQFLLLFPSARHGEALTTLATWRCRYRDEE